MRKILLILMLGICLISLINADTAFFIKKATNYSLKISCENSGIDCSASASCNISIDYPNSTMMISNLSMTNLNNGRFQYNLSENLTSTNGEYTARVNCNDGGAGDISNFIYEVNPAGIRPSDQKTESITRGIYFILIIGVLFFIAFLFTKQSTPAKWTFFSLAMMFFLITLNILFVGLQTEVVNPKLENFFDGFTAISWYIFWFIAGLLILMWFFTFIQTWILKKNLKNMRRYE